MLQSSNALWTWCSIFPPFNTCSNTICSWNSSGMQEPKSSSNIDTPTNRSFMSTNFMSNGHFLRDESRPLNEMADQFPSLSATCKLSHIDELMCQNIDAAVVFVSLVSSQDSRQKSRATYSSNFFLLQKTKLFQTIFHTVCSTYWTSKRSNFFLPIDRE